MHEQFVYKLIGNSIATFCHLFASYKFNFLPRTYGIAHKALRLDVIEQGKIFCFTKRLLRSF